MAKGEGIVFLFIFLGFLCVLVLVGVGIVGYIHNTDDGPAKSPDSPNIVYADRGIEIRKVCFDTSGLFIVVGTRAVDAEYMTEADFNIFCGE